MRRPEAPAFCPLCDVALDLHDGPGTCAQAAQAEFILTLPLVLAMGNRW